MMKKLNDMIEAAEDWLDFTLAGQFVGALLLLTLLVSGWLFLYMIAG